MQAPAAVLLKGFPQLVRFLQYLVWLTTISDRMFARLEYVVMQGKLKEEWMQLCEQAAVEQDTERLMGLITEINRMLDEKEQRLKVAAWRNHLPVIDE